MSLLNNRMWARRRGRTNGTLERGDDPWTPGAEDWLCCTAFSLGEDFSATRISISVPSGSRNQTPLDSNPCGGSICATSNWRSRARKPSKSSA